MFSVVDKDLRNPLLTTHTFQCFSCISVETIHLFPVSTPFSVRIGLFRLSVAYFSVILILCLHFPI